MKNKRGRLDLLTQEQIDWCNEYCNFKWFVKNDGKVYCKNDDIEFKNRDSIILFVVKFGDCKTFDCSSCHSLKSLKGVPENVYGYFSCSYCKSLKSLEGALKRIDGNFHCFHCDSLKSIDGLKNIKIGGKIYYDSCQNLKKYVLILSDMNWFRKWQKSNLTADEFMKEWSGYFEAKKYGI